MTQNQEPQPAPVFAADPGPLPKWLGALTLVLCAALALSAGVGAWAAYALPNTPGWAMIGFELVILIAAAIGVLFGLGRFREAPGLTLASVAGVVFVGSALGYLGVGGVLGSTGLQPPLFARFAAAGLLGLLAAMATLRTDWAAWRTLMLGAVLGGLGLAAGAGAYFAYSRRTHPFRGLSGPAEVARVTGLMIAAIAVVILLSIGLHLVIGAFERRRRRPATA